MTSILINKGHLDIDTHTQKSNPKLKMEAEISLLLLQDEEHLRLQQATKAGGGAWTRCSLTALDELSLQTPDLGLPASRTGRQ